MNSYLNPGPDSPLGEKQASEANREVTWGGEKVATSGRPLGAPRSLIFFVFDPVFFFTLFSHCACEAWYQAKISGTQRRSPPKCVNNTIQSTLRPLQMNSKRHYKISICSVILGKLNTVFQNCKGFSIIFAKILDTIQRVAKKKIFLTPLSVIF